MAGVMRTSGRGTQLHVLVLLLACAGCASVTTRSPANVRQSFREGSGRTVVMLGGGVYGAGMFAPHARELSNEFEVIRVQTLNVQAAATGETMPENYSVASETSALRETLQSLGVTAPVNLVGSSYGAVVALHFAAAYPERVKSVILFEPPAFWLLPKSDFASDPELREMHALTSAMTASAAPTDAQFSRFRCLLGACPSAIPAAGDAARAEWDRSRRAMRGLSAVPAHREDPRRLARLRRPVLLVIGTQTVGFHRRINERLAQMIPGLETAELQGDHGAPRTSVPAFAQLIRDFLHRHP
jgi:pimeloyl-ACP methyl ester carboxylesterase